MKLSPDLQQIYSQLVSRFFSLPDTPDNAVAFLVILDLISFIEENPEATLDDYRELKDFLTKNGPFPRPDARVLN